MIRVALTVAEVLACCIARAEVSPEIRERFYTLYPNIPSPTFDASPVESLIAVRAFDTAFWFAPASGLLLFGEFFTPDGAALPGRVNGQIVDGADTVASDATITGVRVKDGPVSVTAYLDVRCGHCVQAVDWIVSRDGLPRAALDVVFVSRSEQDLALAEHVLCAPPHLRRAALLQVFARGPGSDRLRCKAGREEALAQGGIAARNGVSATPVFAVSGQTVLGFNRERLEALVDQSGR